MATQVSHNKMYEKSLSSFVQRRKKNTYWFNWSPSQSLLGVGSNASLWSFSKGGKKQIRYIRSSCYVVWQEIAFAMSLFRECFLLSMTFFVPLWSLSAAIPNFITIFDQVFNCSCFGDLA